MCQRRDVERDHVCSMTSVPTRKRATSVRALSPPSGAGDVYVVGSGWRTFVLASERLLEAVCWPTERGAVDLGVDELETWDQAGLFFGVLPSPDGERDTGRQSRCEGYEGPSAPPYLERRGIPVDVAEQEEREQTKTCVMA